MGNAHFALFFFLEKHRRLTLLISAAKLTSR